MGIPCGKGGVSMIPFVAMSTRTAATGRARRVFTTKRPAVCSRRAKGRAEHAGGGADSHGTTAGSGVAGWTGCGGRPRKAEPPAG